MKETLQPGVAEGEAVARRSGPKGIGMAVAFDWGLAVQLLATPFLALIPGSSGGFLKLSGLAPLLNALVGTLISLPFAALLIVFGEGIRSGWRWTRPIQFVANSLGFVGGFVTLVNAWQGIQKGNYWPLVPTVILLTFSPLIAWRLSRRETREWFATVASTEARKRHGGMWVFYIVLWAITGGVLQAASTLFGR